MFMSLYNAMRQFKNLCCWFPYSVFHRLKFFFLSPYNSNLKVSDILESLEMYGKCDFDL